MRKCALLPTFLLLVALPVLVPATAEASAWSDVSGSVATTTPPAAVDGSVLASDATVQNTSGAALDARLRLVVSQSNFEVLNADGTTGDSEPYFEIPAPLANGALETIRIEFPILPVAVSYSVRVEQLLPTVDPIVVTSPPTFFLDPFDATPLAGMVYVSTNVPTRATLLITDADETRKVEFPEWETDHELMVLELRTETDYTVEVRLTDQNGSSVFAPPLIDFTTGGLPADFPYVGRLVVGSEGMEPGVILIDQFTNVGYTIVLDKDGQVVWYASDGGQATSQLPNGRILFRDVNAAVELDMVGRRRAVTNLQNTDLHHDLHRTPYGTLLTFTRVGQMVADFPTSETDPNAPTATQLVRDEPVVEFALDGTQLSQWDAMDFMDLTRIGYDGLNNCVSTFGCDWVHANAVTYDPNDDSLIMSYRHQDAVVKIDRLTGQLVWILGNHENWSAPFQPYLLQPQGALEWQYHQHAPMVTPNGNVLLFDNGNYRTSPFDGLTPVPDDQNESRAVEFAIDPQTMEVQQVWEFRFPYEYRNYASFISDADWMPQTGNVLVHFAGTRYINGMSTTDLGLGNVVSRLVEVTHETPAQVLFDVLLFHPTINGRSYRAEKVPSLYPPNVVVSVVPPVMRGSCGLGSFETLAVVVGLMAVRRRRVRR